MLGTSTSSVTALLLLSLLKKLDKLSDRIGLPKRQATIDKRHREAIILITYYIKIYYGQQKTRLYLW